MNVDVVANKTWTHIRVNNSCEYLGKHVWERLFPVLQVAFRAKYTKQPEEWARSTCIHTLK